MIITGSQDASAGSSKVTVIQLKKGTRTSLICPGLSNHRIQWIKVGTMTTRHEIININID